MKNKLLFIAKVFITQISVFVALLCLMSCDNSTMRRNISVADSLSEADQAAAVRYIDSITRAEKGISRNNWMKLLLLKTKALNKLNRPLSIDTLTGLVKYFDRHGTANDRMLANYITGCYYMDNDSSPEAMRYFHVATEAADTTDGNCDYRTLHKVHVHTAQQLMGQNAMADAMDENVLALKYALLAKDTFNAIVTLEQRANIYKYQGLDDKAFGIRSKLYGMYMKHGYAKEAAISLWSLTSMLTERGNFTGAKHCIDIFEKESGLIDSTGNIEKGREAYCLDKAIYMAKVGKLDTALHYLRKCANTAGLSDVLRDSYIGLADVYKKLHNPDSVVKYAELARITTDSLYAKMNTTHLQQVRAMYDYNKYKLSAEVYKRKAVSARLVSAIVILIVAVVLVSVAIYIRRKKRARRMEVLTYEKRITETITTKKELCAVNEKLQAEIKKLIEENNIELKKQKENDETYRQNIQELEKVRDELYKL